MFKHDKKMNNHENDEKDRWENDEDMATSKSLHPNQDILKRYDNVKCGQKDEKEDKIVLKDEKMMKWWNDGARLKIDN